MGQHFELVYLDTRQTAWIGKLGESFYYGVPLKRFTKWKYSQAQFDDMRAAVQRVVPKHTPRSPSCKVLRIPVELISMIFKELDRVRDIICLSLVDARLVTVGLDRVIEIQINRLRDCVGTRLICLGHGALDEEYPENLKSFVKQEIAHVHPDDYPEYPEDRLFYALACETFERLRSDSYSQDKHMDYDEQAYFLRKLCKTFSDEEEFERAIYRLLSPERWSQEPMTGVLCNTSKRHYVRQTALDDLYARRDDGGSGDYKLVDEPNLGHALLSQICWSSDASLSMHNQSIYQGAWVGDCFEVISVDDLEKKKDFSEWVDMSNDIVELLDGLWDDDFGWRANK